MALANNIPKDFRYSATSQPVTPAMKLSPWNQASLCLYMSIALCFRVSHNSPASISEHIQDALGRIAIKRPEFASELVSDASNSLFIQVPTPKPVIPLDSFPADFNFDFTYRELEKLGFPAAAFVNPAFTIPAANPLDGSQPVVRIRLLYIEGGLVMFVHMHHSYGDGSSMDNFLHTLSCELSHKREPHGSTSMKKANVDFDLGTATKEELDFDRLLEKCPEYGLLPEPTGPTQLCLLPVDLDTANYKKTMTGKVFVIESSKLRPVLDCLKEANQGKPITSFLAVRALIWAHSTKARLATQVSTAALFANHPPKFGNPHSWLGKNLFPENDSLKSYSGNGIAVASTTLPSHDILIDACTWKSTKDTDTTPTSLLKVIHQIDTANCAIDQGFVLTRTSLFKAAPDIRLLGVAFDPRNPHSFTCNTWKFLGGSARFWFLGTKGFEGVKPGAIRRVQGEWALPHALFLPARPGVANGDFELLVTLEAGAMEALERDEGWMSLVA